MSILESLCCKKPILLRDMDIYPDILFDGYIKGADNFEFAEKIRILMKDKNELEHWREKSWECHRIYSEDNVLEMWEKLYDEAYKGIKVKSKVCTD